MILLYEQIGLLFQVRIFNSIVRNYDLPECYRADLPMTFPMVYAGDNMQYPGYIIRQINLAFLSNWRTVGSCKIDRMR